MRTSLLALALVGLAATPAPAEDLGTQIATYVASVADEHDIRVVVPPLDRFDGTTLGAGLQVELSTGPKARIPGLVPVRVALRDGEQLVHEGVVTVEVHATRYAAAATRPLRTGHVLGSTDLEVRAFDLDELPSGWTGETEPLVGRRLRRYVATGDPVLQTQVEDVPTVKRGQRVRLRLQRGGLRIDAVGQARQDGRVGDWIRVVNASSRREVLGRVSGDGVIHVAF